jgi:hypothetical protein
MPPAAGAAPAGDEADGPGGSGGSGGSGEASGATTPIPRPAWLKVTAALAAAGVVVWPVLAMLGLLGAIPATTVVNVGIVTAALAYISIRRIKLDRAIALHQAYPPDDDGRP